MIMKKFQWAISMLLLSGIGLLSSCYPNDDITNSETDIVMTQFVDTVHFDRLQTYFLPDTVLPIKSPDDTSTYKKNPYTDLIISTIADNMDAFGYQRIMEPDSNNLPDILVIASSLKSTTTTVWYPYYPGWGWWGWGWSSRYYGWWGGYYPPYYGGPYVSSYTTGTVKINMTDPWNPIEVKGDTVMPVYWDATITGLLQGNLIEDRIKTNIDKAFDLSTYLKKGK